MKMKQSRNTTAKTEIQKLITESGTALSHSELQLQLAGLCDRVTIYRVLERLTAEGLIHKIVNVDGVVRYAACQDCSSAAHHHNHIHFSCQQCKSVTCLEDIEPAFKLPKGYILNEVNFTVSGICPQCA